MVYRNFRKIHSSTCTPFTIWGRSFTLYVAVTLWTKTTTTTKYYLIPRPYAHCTYSKICTLAWFVCWFEILRLFHLWAHHLAHKHSRTQAKRILDCTGSSYRVACLPTVNVSHLKIVNNLTVIPFKSSITKLASAQNARHTHAHAHWCGKMSARIV